LRDPEEWTDDVEIHYFWHGKEWKEARDEVAACLGMKKSTAAELVPKIRKFYN